MANMYKRFAKEIDGLDFSEDAKKQMYEFETFGVGKLKSGLFKASKNGYYVGKKYMDVTIASWKEDLGTILTKHELMQDYPEWFLRSVGIIDYPIKKANEIYYLL